jgi:hypothetical protein
MGSSESTKEKGREGLELEGAFYRTIATRCLGGGILIKLVKTARDIAAFRK